LVLGLWRLGDRRVEGVDILHFNAAGLIDDYAVMVRPLRAVEALRNVVFAQLAQSQPRATE
jgi:hypothetical protein